MTCTQRLTRHATLDDASPPLALIVVGTRGTDDWSAALEAARLLARRYSAPVQVVAVLDPTPCYVYVMTYGVEPPVGDSPTRRRRIPHWASASP
jgi:nucleotide-binding universal stress UspA family protein